MRTDKQTNIGVTQNLISLVLLLLTIITVEVIVYNLLNLRSLLIKHHNIGYISIPHSNLLLIRVNPGHRSRIYISRTTTVRQRIRLIGELTELNPYFILIYLQLLEGPPHSDHSVRTGGQEQVLIGVVLQVPDVLLGTVPVQNAPSVLEGLVLDDPDLYEPFGASRV